MRVLLVEDNLLTVKGLRFLLEQEGFEVVVAGGARAAREAFSRHLYDLVLVDVGLPDQNGFLVAAEVRGLAPEIPIICLTARDDEASVVAGLEAGADDYVTKPFRNRELMARVRAVLRRQGKVAEVLCSGELRLEVGAERLYRAGAEVVLSALEYKIVYLLMLNAGQIVRRERLIDEIWDYAGNVVNSNTLTVYIKRIRGKIGEKAIETVKGVGYRMVDQASEKGSQK